MTDTDLFQTISQAGVVPVIAIDHVESALPLADALLEGGLPIIEITFRTKAAAEVIAQIRRGRPDMLVGAGTVLNQTNLEAAVEAGAQFAVAPGLNPQVVQRAGSLGLPFMPGVCTPSDIEAAVALGCTVLKFFPAEAAGGVTMIKAMAGPYGHLGVEFVPTGGVTMDNLVDYLSLDAVAAVGGTWIAKKDPIAAGRWDEICQRCREAVDLVTRTRR
jgi:2-dehydro-3-deoxyphosphogluconate aldolase/(4S)-4-hydroxy-2-oxoglutarate aldolase